MNKMSELRHMHISQLRAGMYVANPGLDAEKHPYLYMTEGLLESEEAVRRIAEEGYQELYIDPLRSPGLRGLPPLFTEPALTELSSPLATVTAAAPAPSILTPQVALTEELRAAARVHEESVVYVRELMKETRAGRLDITPATDIVERIMTSLERNADALLTLSRLRRVDSYTYMHCVNVCVLTCLFARYLGQDSNRVFQAGLAGLFHDLGKAMVPPMILNAPRKLNHTERNVMNTHPSLGYDQLFRVPGVPETVLLAALHHHEKFDGSGYPQRLAGKDISQIGYMVAAADIYDALTSRRVYKEAMFPHRALGIMYNEMRGKELHAETLVRFVRMLGVYPVGSVVELEDGCRGVVIAGNEGQPLKPVVQVVRDPRGRPLKPHKELDLSGAPFAPDIVRCLSPDNTDIDPAQVLGFGQRLRILS